jgi:transcriptional regulator with XRE-family HTH domain
MDQRNQWIKQAKVRIALKREISGAVQSELARGDFVFPETRSFPIQKPEDVKAAINAWGRATAVRARGFTFEDFQRRLMRLARRKGPSFIAALPAAWEIDKKGVTGNPSPIYAHGPGGMLSPPGLGKRKKAATRLGRFLRQQRIAAGLSLPQLADKMPIIASTIGQIERGEIATPSEPVLVAFAKALIVPKARLDGLLKKNAMPRKSIAHNAAGKNFTVFKDANGRYRWVMVSSSAYKDRDKETVSTRSLERAVAEHDALGDRGLLRWWHVPIKLGDADFGMMHGRMLLESGLFVNERIGQIVKEKEDTLGGSIGFKHPVSEPDANGTFHNISIFERSLLPKDKASNFFTSLTVKECGMSTDKVKEFIELVGPEVAAQVIGDVAATDKQAQEAGFTYKDQTELEEMSADQGLEYFLMMKEHEEAEALKAAAAAEAEAVKVKQEEANTNSDVMPLLERIMAMLEKHEESIMSLTEALSKDEKQEHMEEEGEGKVIGLMNRVKEMLEKHDQAIETLTKSSAAKQSDEQIIDERLAALEGEQPRATQNGYRASQKAEIITDTKEPEPADPNAEALERVKEKQPETAPFLEGANVFTATLPGNAPPGHPFWGGPQPTQE